MAVNMRAAATGMFRFVLVALLALVLLVSAALSIALALAWLWDSPWEIGQDLTLGLICGLIALLFVAAFYLRPETGTLPFTQRDQFVAKAKSVLHDMGYVLASHQGGKLTFRPRFHSYLFGGAICIVLEEQEAKVTGPKVALAIFRKGLRLMNHVQRVQIYLQDHTSKTTEAVLKRVELRLRVSADELDAVRRNVIDVLEKSATVTCEVSLLVQNDKGINEAMLETQVRPWLELQGIGCEIKKNLVQFIEVASSELETVTAD